MPLIGCPTLGRRTGDGRQALQEGGRGLRIGPALPARPQRLAAQGPAALRVAEEGHMATGATAWQRTRLH
eukprot:scaffold224112_cov30-Tisochrysis_lutea.AAC.5